MVRVLTCLTTEHDWQLVLLAGALCFLTSLSALSLLQRARQTSGRVRLVWIITTGIAGGCGIWATHFIATLAYGPGQTAAYELIRTVLSLLVAVTATSVGVGVAVATTRRWEALAGGAIVGSGVVSMHFLGMSAIVLPAQVTWRLDLIGLSITLGIVFSALAIDLALRRIDLRALTGAAALLTLAITSHHFIAIGAEELIPDPSRIVYPLSLSPMSLAVAIAGVAIAVLGISLVSSMADHLIAAARYRLDQSNRQLVADTASKLREHHLQLDTALNNMSQGLCMFDAQANLVICNTRYIEMYGLSPEVGRPGTPLRDMLWQRSQAGTFSGDTDDYISDLRARMLAGKTVSTRNELDDGRVIVVVNQPMPGGGWVATHEDITEQRRAEERIIYLAHHDTLTGLANRAAFADKLSATIESAQAAAERFAIFCIDIDRFKEVNDVFGHSAGDTLLREVAGRMQQAAPDSFVARLGGDEFTLIVDQGQQPAAAAAIADRVLAAFNDDIDVGGRRLRVSLSIGIAVYPTDGTDTATLLSNADAALYRTKAKGRGTFCFFEAEMDMRLRERRALQHELRGAIENDELRVYYQPQARVDGTITGFEALVRWRHSTRGLVPPGTFVPLAEESGLIIPIGEWILRAACREAASWPNPLSIAINLSPVQFQHGDLPALVHSVLIETGLAPHRLELEITESVLIDDFARAVSILRRLKLLGVRVAMDDFGTGYSSLSYLQSFPFDKIKIDRSFISNVERNAQSAAIVRAVIGLALGLGLPVLAEGVETKDQLKFLANESCSEVQGFFVGRPAPIDDYADVVGRINEQQQRRAFG